MPWRVSGRKNTLVFRIFDWGSSTQIPLPCILRNIKKVKQSVQGAPTLGNFLKILVILRIGLGTWSFEINIFINLGTLEHFYARSREFGGKYQLTSLIQLESAHPLYRDYGWVKRQGWGHVLTCKMDSRLFYFSLCPP